MGITSLKRATRESAVRKPTSAGDHTLYMTKTPRTSVLMKVWNDPVGSKIIAAAIIFAVGGVAAWVAHHWSHVWWPSLRRGVAAARAYLVGTSSLPHWGLALLVLGAGLFVVVVLVVAIAIVVQVIKQNQHDPPDWLAYTMDNFFGLKWVWRYEGNREVRLRGVFCPNCNYQLGPDDTSMFASRVSFHCDSCLRTVPVDGHSWESLQSVVERLVHQKLRNRTYPRIARPSAT
jgi:hypothetical protein